MWSAVPKRWFSWDFEVQDATHQPVGEMRLSSWRERGSLSAAGGEYKVTRQGMLGAFVVEREGVELARAEKPSAFRDMFRIEHEGQEYVLKKRSFWRSELVLYAGERGVGSVAREGLFTRRAHADLPAELPVVMRLFVLWLAILLWQRESSA